MKYDGTLHLDGEVTPLQRILLSRRSNRRYAVGAASSDQVEYIEECAKAFGLRTGMEHARLEIVGPSDTRDEVVRAATSGLLGKANPWLSFIGARHFLLAGAVYREGGPLAKTEIALKQASMVMQIAVLAATEVGLGTCWLAAINHDRVERAHPMPDGARIVAISPLGLLPPKMGLSWDAMAYHLISKRRKPLDAIWRKERWQETPAERDR